MKRKRQIHRIRILTVLLLGGSVACLGICLENIVPYIQEERQSAALQAELAALHNGDGDYAEPDGAVVPWKTNGTSAAHALLSGDGDASTLDVNTDTADGGVTVESIEALTMAAAEHAPDDMGDGDLEQDMPDGAGPETSTAERRSGLSTLNQKNPDCIAWITIEGTAIDYPVMYRPKSKNYYIHRDFYGRQSSSGSLYISEICDPDTCDNLIIYGHHMSRGTMFAALDKYKKKSFYEAHPTIRLERLSGVETYEIIFALTTPVYTRNDFKYYAFSRASSAEAFNAFIAGCRARALYDTGKTASYGDKLLTLSTCEYSQKNGRMVVVARRIDP